MCQTLICCTRPDTKAHFVTTFVTCPPLNYWQYFIITSSVHHYLRQQGRFFNEVWECCLSKIVQMYSEMHSSARRRVYSSSCHLSVCSKTSESQRHFASLRNSVVRKKSRQIFYDINVWCCAKAICLGCADLCCNSLLAVLHHPILIKHLSKVLYSKGMLCWGRDEVTYMPFMCLTFSKATVWLLQDKHFLHFMSFVSRG